jgi:hypothetical protein
LVAVLAGYHYEADAALKEKKKGPTLNEALPDFLKKFDQLVKDNGGFLANAKVSYPLKLNLEIYLIHNN